MEKKYSHSLYLLENNEYYISKYDVLGTWDDTDENWEAFFKRTYPELSDKSGKIFKFEPDELLDFINSLKLQNSVK